MASQLCSINHNSCLAIPHQTLKTTMTYPTPGTAHRFINCIRPILFTLSLVALTLWTEVTLHAQNTHYLYGLHNVSDTTDGGVYNLVQFAIADPYGSPTVTSTAIIADLGSFISGYNSSNRYFENINGLAINTSDHSVYFNYTYNDTSTSTTGNYTFQLYRGALNGNTWEVELVHSIIAALSNGLPDSDSASRGAFPRGAFDAANNQ
jgi:hypothetical protein